MRKILLFIPLLFSIMIVNAQFTLTDHDGNTVAEGSTYCQVVDDLNADIGAEFDLHSTTSGNFILDKISTDQPSGTMSYFCVGINCYPPNATTTGPVAVDGSNEALLSLHFRPYGNAGDVTICYNIYKEGDPDTNFELCVKYTEFPENCTTNNINNVKPNALVAFPNPANEKVSISYSANEKAELVIFNIVGEKVIKREVFSGKNKIDIDTSNLPSGTYFYSIISDTKSTKTKRLVIKH